MYIETIEDYLLIYGNTIGRVNRELYKFHNFLETSEDTILVEVSLLKGAGFNYLNYPIYLNIKDIDWRYPDLGWINTTKQAVFTYRNNNSDYKYRRALHQDSFNYIDSSVHRTNKYSIIYNIFNPVYKDFNDCIKLFNKTKKRSFAINNTYCMIKRFSPNIDNIYIYRSVTPIGMLNKDNKLELNDKFSFLFEELCELGIPIC